MNHTTELKASALQHPLRDAAVRRNLGTAAIIAIAFSGGPFGMTWLATSSASTFLMMMIWRAKQQQKN